MKDRMKEKGITLIEMVSVIVVLGVSIPFLLRAWSDIAWRSSRSEAVADSTFYAGQLMEEIKAKEFDERAGSPWSPNSPALFGPESAETYSAYNDVDDFNGYADSPAGIYTRCVTVDYVTLSGSTWTGNCAPVNPAVCGAVTCSAAQRTDYKRIIVGVRRNNLNLSGDTTLVTIVSGY